MTIVGTARSVQVSHIAWYLSGRLTDLERLDHARAANAVVLRGRRGHGAAAKLRKAGFAGRLWLDAAVWEWSPWERSRQQPRETLLGDNWELQQRELAIEELLSPGSYVPESDLRELDLALDTEGEWAENVGGRLSLVLHVSWLTTGLGQLIDRLERLETPLALAFADPNDPLGRPGAVQGLVDVLRSVDDVAILRCDLGAVGAVAHGASMGAIGTSTMVRHAVPPGKRAGGRPHDSSPSVFVAELLDFKLGSFLDEWPREASPTCDLACCLGRPLRCLNGEHAAADARTHNRIAIGAVVRKILETPPEARAETFKAMCMAASYSVARLAVAARRPLKLRPQIKAWAEVR